MDSNGKSTPARGQSPGRPKTVVTSAGAAKFREAQIDNPADCFKGKTIRVQGIVILKEGWPSIEVDEPSQIEIVG